MEQPLLDKNTPEDLNLNIKKLPKYLINFKQAFGDYREWEVFLQLILINNVFPFFDTCHVITHVPHVDLVIKCISILFTLKNTVKTKPLQQGVIYAEFHLFGGKVLRKNDKAKDALW